MTYTRLTGNEIDKLDAFAELSIRDKLTVNAVIGAFAGLHWTGQQVGAELKQAMTMIGGSYDIKLFDTLFDIVTIKLARLDRKMRD